VPSKEPANRKGDTEAEKSNPPPDELQIVALPDDSLIMEAIIHQSIKAGQATHLFKSPPIPLQASSTPIRTSRKWFLIFAFFSLSMVLVFSSLQWLMEGKKGDPDRPGKPLPEVGTTSSLVLPTNSQPVKSAAFSADTRYMLSSDGKSNLRVRDLMTDRELHLHEDNGEIKGGILSSDGRYLFANRSTSISQLDAETGEGLRVFSAPEKDAAIVSISLAANGERITAGYADGVVRMWTVATGEEISAFNVSSVGAGTSRIAPSEIVFSSDGNFALTASELPGVPINVWDIVTGKSISTFANKAQRLVSSLAISSNGEHVLSGSSDGKVRLWDVSTGEEKHVFEGHSERITALAFGRDGQYALSASPDRLIKLWDVREKKEVRTFKGHDDIVNSVSFSPDGRYVISGSEDRTARLWDTETGDLKLSWIYLDKGDWVSVTPEGFFDGSPRGMQLVQYKKEGKAIPLEALFDRYYTPSLVPRLMAGKLEQQSVTDIREELSPPPLVTITKPQSEESFKVPAIEVIVAARDQGGGVEDIRLYHNGKLVGTETRGLKKKRNYPEGQVRLFSIQLLPGENILQGTAFSRDRTKASSDKLRVSLQEAEATSTLFVLSIGIDQYENPRYSLNYAQRDAEAIATTLSTVGKYIFKDTQIFTLFDREATRQKMLDALAEIESRARPEDVFVLFYAGHGLMSEGVSAPSDFFLAMTDVIRFYGHDALLEKKGISARELREKSTAIAARKQLLILDACQSGGAIETFAMRGVAEEKAIHQLQRSAGIALIVSSGTNQFASEVEIIGHGVLTYALLQALNGAADGSPQDGKITTGELGTFIEDMVPEICRRHHLEPQYPNSYTRGQNFPLGTCAVNVDYESDL
jgi:WD40 repeat protein